MAWKAKPHNKTPGCGVLLRNVRKKSERSGDWFGVITMDRDVRKGETLNIVAWNKPVNFGNLISLRINWYQEGWGRQEFREILIKEEGEIE